VVKDATASYADEHMHAFSRSTSQTTLVPSLRRMKSLLPSLPPPAWKSVPGPDLRIETRMVSRFWCEC
jgi:hypothetical protein